MYLHNYFDAGMLQMLMDTPLNSTQLDYARTAQASGKALITLINEVLDQAKIESGRLELEHVPFDLRAILDDVLSLFHGKSRASGIEVGLKNFTPVCNLLSCVDGGTGISSVYFHLHQLSLCMGKF